MMIEVVMNNTKYQIESGRNLADVLRQWNYNGNYFAVAINQKIIPTSYYQTTILQDSDQIDILAPMQGG